MIYCPSKEKLVNEICKDSQGCEIVFESYEEYLVGSLYSPQSNNGMSNAHRKTICKVTEHRQLHCPRPTSSVCSVYQKPSERG